MLLIIVELVGVIWCRLAVQGPEFPLQSTTANKQRTFYHFSIALGED